MTLLSDLFDKHREHLESVASSVALHGLDVAASYAGMALDNEHKKLSAHGVRVVILWINRSVSRETVDPRS